MNGIYLDNNATTPVLPAVWEAMRPFLTESYGNPASAHWAGRRARQALEDFLASNRVEFIAADLPALSASAAKSAEVTDSYLAELAARNNMRLATLDEGIKHPAAELIKK